jgi:hypothetical protein
MNNSRFKQITLNKYSLFSSAVIFQGLFSVILSRRTFPVYGINDDVIIKSWLSGDYTGNPEFFVQGQATPRILFGHVVSFFYRNFPGFEWFSLLLLASVIISWSLIFVLVNKLSEGKIRIYSNLALLLFYVVFYSSYFVTPTYTAAAFLPSSSALLLLIYLVYQEKLNVKYVLFVSFWLFWGFSIRSEAALFSIISVSFLICYLLYRHWVSLRITLLAALYFGLFVFAGEVAERQVYNSNISWQNYKDFESARYQIQDNLIERNLSSNPTNYGWTEAEYLIFDDYLYADPTVFTTDKLKQATESELNDTRVVFSGLFRDFQENSRNPLFPWTGVIAALIIFGVTSILIRPQRMWAAVCSRLFFLTPIFLSFFYISTTLRLPERVVISTLYLIFIVILTTILIENKRTEKKENSNNIPGFILSLLGLVLIYAELENTQNWMIERHKNVFYRDFWDYQKEMINNLPQNTILIGNQSQKKSDWSYPYSRQDVESNFNYLTLGWHTFSPHWEKRKNDLGLQNMNILRDLPTDKRIIWIGNDSSVESLKLYVKEKLDLDLNPQTLDTLKIGTFEYKLFTLFVP